MNNILYSLGKEMMVLAGEAIGKWNIREEKTSDTLSENEGKILKNTLRLPFRSQPKPGKLVSFSLF
jgi:hypothetical protein